MRSVCGRFVRVRWTDRVKAYVQSRSLVMDGWGHLQKFVTRVIDLSAILKYNEIVYEIIENKEINKVSP